MRHGLLDLGGALKVALWPTAASSARRGLSATAEKLTLRAPVHPLANQAKLVWKDIAISTISAAVPAPSNSCRITARPISGPSIPAKRHALRCEALPAPSFRIAPPVLGNVFADFVITTVRQLAAGFCQYGIQTCLYAFVEITHGQPPSLSEPKTMLYFPARLRRPDDCPYLYRLK